jgi:hypothetical protein
MREVVFLISRTATEIAWLGGMILADVILSNLRHEEL